MPTRISRTRTCRTGATDQESGTDEDPDTTTSPDSDEDLDTTATANHHVTHHSGAPADDAVTEMLDPAGPAQAI